MSGESLDGFSQFGCNSKQVPKEWAMGKTKFCGVSPIVRRPITEVRDLELYRTY